MLNDKLFLRTGIEVDQLDIVWGMLKLDTDPDYLEMIKEFEETIALIHKEAKARDSK